MARSIPIERTASKGAGRRALPSFRADGTCNLPSGAFHLDWVSTTDKPLPELKRHPEFRFTIPMTSGEVTRVGVLKDGHSDILVVESERVGKVWTRVSRVRGGTVVPFYLGTGGRNTTGKPGRGSAVAVHCTSEVAHGIDFDSGEAVTVALEHFRHSSDSADTAMTINPFRCLFIVRRPSKWRIDVLLLLSENPGTGTVNAWCLEVNVKNQERDDGLRRVRMNSISGQHFKVRVKFRDDMYVEHRPYSWVGK